MVQQVLSILDYCTRRPLFSQLGVEMLKKKCSDADQNIYFSRSTLSNLTFTPLEYLVWSTLCTFSWSRYYTTVAALPHDSNLPASKALPHGRLVLNHTQGLLK